MALISSCTAPMASPPASGEFVGGLALALALEVPRGDFGVTGPGLTSFTGLVQGGECMASCTVCSSAGENCSNIASTGTSEKRSGALDGNDKNCVRENVKLKWNREEIGISLCLPVTPHF